MSRSSPFSIFRKNQKLMYAVLTLMAMISFVFLPIILQNMGGRAAKNPIIVTSKYGSLQASGLQILTQQRHQILAVLNDLVQQLGANPSVAQQYVFRMMRIESTSEESVIDSWLLARYGQQLGMVVSNSAINTFLKDLTQDRVPSPVMQGVLKSHGFSDYQFFNAMRDELAAIELKRMFHVSVAGMPPAQRWHYFARVNQMATIQALPVVVGKFTDAIAEPTEEQLKKFFEEHKNAYPRPDLPDPGFREPPMIALEYFKAPLDKFIAAVTDEELQKRYEKNKDAYDAYAKKLAEEKPMTEKPAEEKPAAEKSTEEKPAAERPLEDGDKKAAPETEKDKQPTNDGKDAKQPAETKEPEKAKETPKDSKDSSALERPSPFMLTAVTKDEPAKAETKEQAQPAAKDAEPAKDAKPAEATPPPAQEKPAEATPPPAQEKPAEVKTGLTDALKTQIRQEIAYEKMTDIFKGLLAQMGEYQREWRRYDAERIRQQRKEKEGPGQESNTALTPPERPDFEKLAKEAGLTTDHTELVSEWQARDLEIGSSLVNGQIPLWRYAFSTLAQFSPEESVNAEGDRYLFWKTKETKDRVPEFSEEGVQKDVARWWRIVKARELAIKKAKELADEAGKTTTALKEQTFVGWTDASVVTAGPFSWLTFGHVAAGSAPGAARLSNVEGVDMAGEDFMKTVFGLEPGQVGAAMNAPQTVAYVIQLSELSPPQEMLWRQFEKESFSKYQSVAIADVDKMRKAWLQGIKTAAEFKFTDAYNKTHETQGVPPPQPEDQDEE
jgi:hypothetical protein